MFRELLGSGKKSSLVEAAFRDFSNMLRQAARMLRRISAHLSNIASSVVQPFDRIRHGDEDV